MKKAVSCIIGAVLSKDWTKLRLSSACAAGLTKEACVLVWIIADCRYYKELFCKNRGSTHSFFFYIHHNVFITLLQESRNRIFVNHQVVSRRKNVCIWNIYNHWIFWELAIDLHDVIFFYLSSNHVVSKIMRKVILRGLWVAVSAHDKAYSKGSMLAEIYCHLFIPTVR